jgi:hypothetical protein
MGHNGGFNPYRDANGEFATPQQAGKPGRKRGGGAASGHSAGTSKGIQRATAVGQAIPNPGIDYRSRKLSRKPSQNSEIYAGEVKSSLAGSFGRMGPMAGENEDRVSRGFSPLKDARPRTTVRAPRQKSQPAPAAPSAPARSSRSKGIQRATAVSQAIPNPGIVYSGKVKREPSLNTLLGARNNKSSVASSLGRIGPQAMENEYRVARGLAPLKPTQPRRQIRPKK